MLANMAGITTNSTRPSESRVLLPKGKLETSINADEGAVNKAKPKEEAAQWRGRWMTEHAFSHLFTSWQLVLFLGAATSTSWPSLPVFPKHSPLSPSVDSILLEKLSTS